MKSSKSQFNLIKTILFYIFTFILLIYVALSLFVPDKVIDVFRFQITTISRLTESMKPTIEPGDIIVLRKISEDNIEENDVISFYNYARGRTQNNEEVWVKIRIVHRLLEIKDDGSYITAGDNNFNSNDELIIDTIYDEHGEITTLTYDQVIGLYVFRVPFVGTIVNGLRNPVLVGLLIVNVSIVVFIVKYIKHSSSKTDEQGE